MMSTNSLWVGTAFNRVPTGGDSGHPVAMLIGTNLVLCGHVYSSGTESPNYAEMIPAINAAMHFLSTNNVTGTDYQIQNADLSAFQTY
jgi:dihydroxyacetone kinase